MDIKLKDEKSKFKYRVGAVIINNGKILTVRNHHAPYLCCPGGHIHLDENSLDAIKRELFEETGLKTKQAKLVCINENFYSNKLNFHELGFYYLVEVENLNDRDKDFSLTENDEGHLIDLEFKWLNFDELLQNNFKPACLINKLKSQNYRLEHIITENE